MSLTRRGFAKAAAGVAFVAGFGGVSGAWAQSADTIKVGVLHSLSGTMAISETTLKDVMLMLIEEQNKKGGLLGKKLEAVVVDPASDWPLFAEKARELIAVNKVAAVFGCWTSVSRKSVLPVFKELNSILFYPVQYEGEESERNVFYTGAAPNQQAIPAVDYLMANEKVERWVLAGTDYVYPRTTNKILEAYLKAKGVAAEDIMINYTPFGHSDWQTIVVRHQEVRLAPARRRPWSPPSTATPTCPSTRNWPTRASRPKTFRSSPSRWARKNSPASTPARSSATSRPGTTSSPSTRRRTPSSSRPGRPSPRTTSASPTIRWKRTIIGFNMWVKAVEKAGTTDPDAVIDAIIGVSVPNLSGGFSAMMPNHHITKPVLIGEIQENGQFDIVWSTPGLVVGDEWSDYPAGVEGPDRRLARAHVLRQLQRRHRQVRRRLIA